MQKIILFLLYIKSLSTSLSFQMLIGNQETEWQKRMNLAIPQVATVRDMVYKEKVLLYRGKKSQCV